jgi:DNA-binding IclR family transcriptional regulator
MDKPDYTVTAALNAARILRRLATTGSGQRLTEISRALDINTSTCLNILRTLVDGMTAVLWRKTDAHLAIAASASPEGMMGLHTPVGTKVPLLAGSMGRVAAALGGLETAELRRRFAEVSWQAPLSFQTYMEQAAGVYGPGWAVDAGELQRNIWGISAPIPAPGRPVSQILCLVAAANHVPDPQMQEIGRDLVRVAGAIAEGVVLAD